MSLRNDTTYCKIISWNVNGLRAVIKNHPNVFQDLLERQDADVIFLQETKLQNDHVKDFVDMLSNYKGYWLCSEVKKGYSGTVMFIKNNFHVDESVAVPNKSKQPSILNMFKKSSASCGVDVVGSNTYIADVNADKVVSERLNPKTENVKISYDLGEPKFNGEGRTITVEFPSFILVGCYVPNSGEGLKRLDFRVNEWDPHLQAYIKRLSERKPVVLAGDLNVAHLDIDIHNPDAKHVPKQAGLTPQERASFSKMLSEGFCDSFRSLHPDSKGQFTYWSTRMRNRETNKGLRLDYFICSQSMMTNSSTSLSDETAEAATQLGRGSIGAKVVDSYILHDFGVDISDHCPVVLVLEV